MHLSHGLTASRLRAMAPTLPSGNRYFVGFSGGLDSTVLLAALHEAQVGPLVAVHIHHGLQAAADGWADRCRSVCERMGVALEVQRVHVDVHAGDGPEAAARRARYAAFANVMQAGDCLALAHHMDDQAETLLLNLLRGAGVRGLGAMNALTTFARGWLWRPLLDFPRSALRDWARERDLKWVEDPQNQELRYRRVWLRRELMPNLETVMPGVARRLARTARVAREATVLLEDLAAIDLGEAARDGALDIPLLQKLGPARRHNLLRYWLDVRGFGLPPAAFLDRLDVEVLRARADAEPSLRYGRCEMRRYRDGLYAMAPLVAVPEPASLRWEAGERLALPRGCGRLLAVSPPSQPLQVTVGSRGQRLRPAGRAHARTLKNLFQEAGVPPWQRRRMPMLWLDGEPAWLPGVARSAAWASWCRANGWSASWECPWRAKAVSGATETAGGI
ncbi:MAG TPA: tRNA lysidine(34) synthetase TilS [Nevskiaceae bacterium]